MRQFCILNVFFLQKKAVHGVMDFCHAFVMIGVFMQNRQEGGVK